MAQTFYPITPVNVTPSTTGAWTDVNVSSYIPSGATGVVLHVTATNDWVFGYRKNGSTDARTGTMRPNSHAWAMIGVDANRIFEAYIQMTACPTIWLVGYTMTGVTFLTNGVNKSPGSTGSWVDMNCSSDAPSSVAVIFEIIETDASNTAFGLRKNGSTDNRVTTVHTRSCLGAIIGVDASQICEGYKGGSLVYMYLVGYATDGVTMNTNATDVSLTGTASWTDLSALPTGAVMGFIEISSSASYKYGLRKNGSSENIYLVTLNHNWGFVECDASYIIEGKIANTAVDFFVSGYASVAGVTTYEMSCSDGLKAGESLVKGSKTMSLSLTDGLKGSESTAQPTTMVKTATDGLKLSDLSLGALGYSMLASDGLKLSDTVLNILGYGLLASDGLKVGESLSHLYQANPSITDGFKLSETLLAKLLIQALLSEGLKLSDTPTTVEEYNVTPVAQAQFTGGYAHQTQYKDGYVYFTLRNSSYPWIYRVSATNYASYSHLVLSGAASGISDCEIVGNFIWTCPYNNGSFFQIDLSDFSIEHEYTGAYADAMCCDGTYLYLVGGYGYVTQYDLSGNPVNFVDKGSQYFHGIVEDGDYLYLNSYTEGVVYKLLKSDLSTVATSVALGSCTDDIAQDANYIYLARETGTAGVVRVKKSDLSVTVVSPSGMGYSYGAFIYGNKLIQIDITNTKLWIFSIPSLVLEKIVTLTGLSYSGAPCEISYDGQYLHIAQWDSSNTALIKIAVADFGGLGAETYELSLTDGLKLSEVNAGKLALALALSDGLKQSDVTTGVITAFNTLLDGLKVSDTPIAKLITNALLSEGIKLSDLATIAAGIYELLATDGIKHGETLSTLLQTTPILTDGVKPGDSVTTQRLTYPILNDGTKLGETISRLFQSNPTLTDGLKPGDSATTQKTTNPTLSDGTKVSDALIAQIVLNALAQDGIKLGDLASKIYFLNLLLQEGLKLSDASTLADLYFLALADQLNLGDLPSTLANLQALIQDGLKLSDSPLTNAILQMALSEGLKLSDVAQVTAAIYQILVSDGLKMSDSPITKALFQVSLSDGLKLSDIAQVAATIYELLVSDGFKLGDSTSVRLNFLMAITEALILSDAIITQKTANPTISDGMKISDVLATDIIYVIGRLLRIIFGKRNYRKAALINRPYQQILFDNRHYRDTTITMREV